MVERLPALRQGLAELVASIEAAFAGVPADEREMILVGNAQRLYRFGSK